MKKIQVILLFLIFSEITFSQNKPKKLSNEDLKSVSKDACNCISKIDYNILAKNDSIKSCISSKLLFYQIKQSLLITKNDSLSNVIITGNNTYKYKQVENNLLRTCKKLKNLMMNNDVEYENSISDKKKALKFYDKALPFYNNGDYLKAIPLFKKALKSDSKFSFAWDNLGICYRRTKQYKKAIKAYRKSMKLDPEGRTPIMNLGIVYLELKEYNKAIEMYEKYITLLQDDPEGYYGISRIYLEIKDYDKALKNIMIALRIYTEKSSPYRSDAIDVIQKLYNVMKTDNKLDEFNKLAKKYNLNIE